MKYLSSVYSFLKKETVLCIAGILAFLSAFFVPPSAEYLSYPDYRVLALLFSLMLVVAGLQSIGVFKYLGNLLLKKAASTRQLALLLTALCFFSSMFITNDVALITFVPFAVMVLTMSGQDSLLMQVIVLQTLADNLGSMLTPVGNPQNLYLYSAYSLSMGSFLSYMLPLAALSALLLCLCVLLLKREPLSPLLPGSPETHASGIAPMPQDTKLHSPGRHPFVRFHGRGASTALRGQHRRPGNVGCLFGQPDLLPPLRRGKRRRKGRLSEKLYLL